MHDPLSVQRCDDAQAKIIWLMAWGRRGREDDIKIGKGIGGLAALCNAMCARMTKLENAKKKTRGSFVMAESDKSTDRPTRCSTSRRIDADMGSSSSSSSSSSSGSSSNNIQT